MVQIMTLSFLHPSETTLRWYCADKPWPNPFVTAEKAFQEGVKIFEESLAKASAEQRRVEQQQASSLQDVLDAALAAKTHYQSKSSSIRLRECIAAFSARICRYGNVMDVLGQHHPEYVSLVWGAMKMLFGVCELLDRRGNIDIDNNFRPLSSMKTLVEQSSLL